MSPDWWVSQERPVSEAEAPPLRLPRLLSVAQAFCSRIQLLGSGCRDGVAGGRPAIVSRARLCGFLFRSRGVFGACREESVTPLPQAPAQAVNTVQPDRLLSFRTAFSGARGKLCVLSVREQARRRPTKAVGRGRALWKECERRGE